MSSKFIINNMSKIFFQKNENIFKEIFKNINLEISGNKITVILGKSGCGKTTLLRILAGLENISDGKVSFLDNNNFEKKAKIGMVFQEPRLLPWLNIEKNLTVFNEKEVINIDKILSLVSLKNIKNLYPCELSGGMASRVAIGRAIAYNPDILLMDEPFSSLDYFTRIQLQKEIIKIHKETKKGIIFVTHNIEEALLLGKKIIIINEKGIEQLKIDEDYPRDITSSYFINLKKEILNKLL